MPHHEKATGKFEYKSVTQVFIF